MRIAVLGAGRVGRTMAAELAKKYDVTAFDKDENCLALLQPDSTKVSVQQAELSDYSGYPEMLQSFDFVVLMC
jgi:saccharopine dehydrogenase-like NADP-dependent oxidoreductase